MNEVFQNTFLWFYSLYFIVAKLCLFHPCEERHSFSEIENIPHTHEKEVYLRPPRPWHDFISLYAIFAAKFATLTQKWTSDLGIDSEVQDWTQIWESAKSCSISVLAAETIYNILMRWYLVPCRVALYNPLRSPSAFITVGRHTFFHVWWAYPVARQLWMGIFKMFSELFNVPVLFAAQYTFLNLNLQG